MKHKTGRAAAAAVLALTLAGCAPSALDGPVADPGADAVPYVPHPTPTDEPSVFDPPAPETPETPEPVEPEPGEWVLGTVTRVVDGDTFEATVHGEEWTVRVLGIDTPETKHPRVGVECFGPEAAAEADLILSGNDVHLIADPTQDDEDRYGRKLRFVEMAYGGGDFGEHMIANGFATNYIFGGNPHARADRYATAEAEARGLLYGLWTCPSS